MSQFEIISPELFSVMISHLKKYLLDRKSRKYRPSPIHNKFRVPRLWSNSELRRFAHLFDGDVVNISGWTDTDKEEGFYRDYFINASRYAITNYPDDSDRGTQELDGEINLNLENELPNNLIKSFDVSFNHTVLEHIFNVRKAFSNICMISRKTVITVVPYIQQLHGINDNVGDYWRFTPLTMKRLYEENGLTLRYCSANGNSSTSSIYLFCIGYKNGLYDRKIPFRFDIKLNENLEFSINNVIGANLIR